MKFLVCGLGSIGQRHVRIIRSLLGNTAEIYAHRSRKLNIIINDDMTAFEEDPVIFYKLDGEFSSLQAAFSAYQYDAVFVTNPIHLHVSTALQAADYGSNLFIEKPVSDNLINLDKLQLFIKEKELVVQIGYQFRFHPALIAIKNLLEDGSLGEILSAEFHFGEWLPGMHPYEDYRTSHAARAKEGGGVIRCLSHEIHLAYWLLGELTLLSAHCGQASQLEMDVEDIATMVAKSSLCPHILIHLNFIESPPRRYLAIEGSKKSIFFDFYSNELSCYDKLTKTDSKKIFNIIRNDLFTDQLKHFLMCIETKSTPFVDLKAAIAVQSFCEQVLTIFLPTSSPSIN